MEYITFKQNGYIGTITINRPRALNALYEQVLTELDQLLDEVAELNLRCLILTGAGEKAFVVGAKYVWSAGNRPGHHCRVWRYTAVPSPS